MKHIFVYLSVFLFFSMYAAADAHMLKKGRIYSGCAAQSPYSPIGKVRVRIESTSSTGWKGYIMLFDRDDKILFRGKTGSEYNPDISALCGDSNGRAWPVLAADIDGDGYIEIVIAEVRTEIVPQSYRVLRWKDGELQYVRNGYLTSRAVHEFTWTELPNPNIPWLMKLRESPAGEICAESCCLIEDGGAAEIKDSILKITDYGFYAVYKL